MVGWKVEMRDFIEEHVACCPTRLRSYHFRFRLINDASPDYWLFWVSEQAVAFDVDVDVT